MRDSTDHSTGGQYRLVSNGKKVPAARHDTPGGGRLLLCRLDARRSYAGCREFGDTDAGGGSHLAARFICFCRAAIILRIAA